MLKITRRDTESTETPDGVVELDWDNRRRTRFVTRLTDGRDLSLHLDRPSPGQAQHLRDGDRLIGEDDDGRAVVIVVSAQAERLIEVTCQDWTALARCAYHLGNRHALVQVLAGEAGAPARLRTANDPVMEPMLVGLGAVVSRVEAPFEPEVGAYAHGHDHAGKHDHGSAKIHRFVMKS